MSEYKSAGLVGDGLNKPLLVGTFSSEPVVNVGRASIVSRKEGSFASGERLDVVDRLLSRDGGELEFGVHLVVGGSELGVVVAVSALSEVGQVVGLAQSLYHLLAFQSGSHWGVGVVFFNLEPLVVVAFGVPEVNSIPNVSCGKMLLRAVSSTDADSVGAVLSGNLGEGPLLSAAVIVSVPEVNVGISAPLSNTEELSVTVSVVDQVESVQLSRDRHSSPAVVSLELHVCVEEGLVFAAVVVAGKLNESVSLSEGGYLDDGGELDGRWGRNKSGSKKHGRVVRGGSEVDRVHVHVGGQVHLGAVSATRHLQSEETAAGVFEVPDGPA